MTDDSLNKAKLNAGKNICESPSSVKIELVMPKYVATSPRPVDGSQPRLTEKNMINIMPTQKVGIENPSIDPAIIVLLTLLFGFKPAYIPRGIPNTTAIKSENNASSIVAGMR